MRCYLVRHAQAEDGSDDASRPLSKKGRADAGKIASRLATLDIGSLNIYHSPLLRARQTAEIIADSLGTAVSHIGEEAGLLPCDNAAPWAQRLTGSNNDTMLVGHLPYLEELAACLVGAKKSSTPIVFKKGAVACFEKDGDAWSLNWLITPKVIR